MVFGLDLKLLQLFAKTMFLTAMINFYQQECNAAHLVSSQGLFNSITGPCTPPFKLVGDGCYYYSSHIDVVVDSYQAAEQMYEGTGGHLAIVDTEAKNDAIVERFFGSSGKHI